MLGSAGRELDFILGWYTLKELNFARTKFRGNLISRELNFANGIDSRNLISAKFNYNSKSCKIGARNARKLSFCGQFAKFNSREKCNWLIREI